MQSQFDASSTAPQTIENIGCVGQPVRLTQSVRLNIIVNGISHLTGHYETWNTLSRGLFDNFRQ